MNKCRSLLSLSFVFIVTTALSGCLEESEVTFHEPGVYQGAEDSMSSDSAALQARMQGQLDR